MKSETISFGRIACIVFVASSLLIISWKKGKELPSVHETAATLTGTAEGFESSMEDSSGNITKVLQYADARNDTLSGVVICSTGAADKLSPGKAMVGRGVSPK
jgi:NifU-like protein involved in Fe-S cluster formation